MMKRYDQMSDIFKRTILLLLGLLLLGGLLIATADRATAGPPEQSGAPGTTMQECVICHAGHVSNVNLQMPFPSGEVKSVQVDPAAFLNSVHGEVLQCQACHQDVGGYPHRDRRFINENIRDVGFLIRQYGVCGDCHEEAYTHYLGSVHAQALANGNPEAAVCSDCHGSHDIETANAEADGGLALRPAVYSCSKCHQEEFAEYQASVHGRPLLEQGDPNAPACVDCHGVHQIVSPTTTDFRRQSPYLCATCHADQSLMREYGLSTQIMDSYVADFHGTTAHLFTYEEGKELNQAVCNDCHGVHDIRSVIDPDSSIIRENLLATCQKCHEDATVNFPDAWTGHYQPTPYENAPVYWIRTIYNVIFTVGMAGLIGHIVLDMGHTAFTSPRRSNLGKKSEEKQADD
jgi:hypothetical protein